MVLSPILLDLCVCGGSPVDDEVKQVDRKIGR